MAFFGVCLVCHGELAKDRPPPEHLTAFYFWMSLGGVLGGLFNALVAPVMFHKLGMVEYPLALVLAAMVRPRSEEPGDGRGCCIGGRAAGAGSCSGRGRAGAGGAAAS